MTLLSSVPSIPHPPPPPVKRSKSVISKNMVIKKTPRHDKKCAVILNQPEIYTLLGLVRAALDCGIAEDDLAHLRDLRSCLMKLTVHAV